MAKPQSRTAVALIVRRWFSVLALGTLIFAVVLATAWLERTKLHAMVGLPIWLLAIEAAGPVVALALYLGAARFVGALGLRHTLVNPPYWLGAFVGIGWALYAISNIEAFDTYFNVDAARDDALQHWAFFFIAVPAAMLLAHAFVRVIRRLVVNGDRWSESDDAIPGPNQRTLDTWYAGDEAVTSAADDLLDYEPIAERIARRLIGDGAQAQALLGRLGAGKTTIRFLVEEYLRIRYPRAPIAVVSVELWPYDSPAAVVEGVLRTVVDAFASHAYTSQLKGLPEAYAEAVATGVGVSKWIPRVRPRAATPFDVLKQLDEVAKVIDHRIVLWVDDLERFAFGDPGVRDHDPTELARLSPVRALLYGLDRLDSITVVTATTDLFQRFDLEKIARYVERLPDISQRKARSIIARARKDWMSGKTYIDPVASRGKLGWEFRDEEVGFDFLGHTVHDLATSVSTMATTPRVLKQGLRRCGEVWERHRGEVDLDDVLAMSMVREAVPDAFAIVERNVQRLRGLVFDPRGRETNPVDEVGKEIESLKLDEKTTKAVQFVLHNLFDKHDARPQGFLQKNHMDYWDRFMLAEAPSDAVTDQSVLSVLTTGSDEAIVKLLSTHPAAVEDFARMVPLARIQRLVVPFVRAHLDEQQASWPKDKDPPGLIPLWRTMRHHRDGSVDVDRMTDDALEAIAIAAPKNLALMERVTNWITASSPEIVDLLPHEQRDRIVRRARELLRDMYTGKPDALVSSLKGALPYTLVWLCWTKPEIRGGRTEVPFDGWPEFVATMRAAIALAPVEMAPQLAWFVVDQIGTPEQLAFVPQRCEALLGDPDTLIAEIKAALAGREAGPAVAAMLEKRAQRYYSDELHDEEPAF